MPPLAVVDVDAVPAPAFALAETLAATTTPWHRHGKHQLLYAAAGTLRLEAEGKAWLLPPQRAAWLRAGCDHRVITRAPVELRTFYLAPTLVAHLPLDRAACLVFPATPLLREMILHGMRWGPGRDAADTIATRFFVTCADLCAEAAAAARPLWLPTARSPEIARVMEFTLANLGRKLGARDAAHAAALSPRTLTRRFREETQMSWLQFLATARLLRAMELLAAPGARVGTVAAQLGWDSLPAFSRAFERFAGESPRDFRHRQKG